MQPTRLGLGLRPPLPSYGQGPSISALAQQQQMNLQGFVPPQAQKQISLFVGSISGGITDGFLNDLLSVSIYLPTTCRWLMRKCDRLVEMSSLSSG